MKILVDVDDVVADLLPTWLDLYNRDYDDTVEPFDITEWDLTKFVKPECGSKIYDYLEDLNLYRFVPPVYTAKDGVDALREAGHELLFVTVRDHPNKFSWLVEYGFIPANNGNPDRAQYVVTHRKDLIPADVIIDDNPENLRNHPGKRVLFTRTHNQGSTVDAFRADTWDEVVEFIENIAAVFTIANNLDQMRSLLEEGKVGAYPDVTAYKISGIGKDAPIAVSASGGMQSKLDYRFDLIDPVTMFALANVLDYGARRYAPNNWRRISINDHLNHALSHIYGYLAQDKSDDHLAHAFTRLMFALSLHLNPGDVPWLPVEK